MSIFISPRQRVILAALALALGGCIHTGFTATGTLRMPRRPENCYVDVILEGQPAFPYVVLGRVSTEGTAPGLFALGENEQVALQRLKKEACAAGGHLLLGANTASTGQWTGDGYSRATRGTAVVAVYVAPDGTPLPPPGGPVTQVHMPDGGVQLVHPGGKPPPAYSPPPAGPARASAP